MAAFRNQLRDQFNMAIDHVDRLPYRDQRDEMSESRAKIMTRLKVKAEKLSCSSAEITEVGFRSTSKKLGIIVNEIDSIARNPKMGGKALRRIEKMVEDLPGYPIQYVVGAHSREWHCPGEGGHIISSSRCSYHPNEKPKLLK